MHGAVKFIEVAVEVGARALRWRCGVAHSGVMAQAPVLAKRVRDRRRPAHRGILVQRNAP
jgi:hypothetical protein